MSNRRTLLAAAPVLAAATATEVAAQPAGPLVPKLELAFTAFVQIGPVQQIGPVPCGTARVIPITGGTFEGPRLKGKVLPGGADWQLTRPDGVTVADAIYAIETDDGALIQIRNKGLRHGPAEVMDRLRRGEEVDPAEYYFRTVPEFIAPEGPYDWLNRSIFVCSGARYASSIKLWVWRVL